MRDDTGPQWKAGLYGWWERFVVVTLQVCLLAILIGLAAGTLGVAFRMVLGRG